MASMGLDKLLTLFMSDAAGFKSEPNQILALRKALGWSRQTLGRYLGLYVDPEECYTIYRWEKGLASDRRQELFPVRISDYRRSGQTTLPFQISHEPFGLQSSKCISR